MAKRSYRKDYLTQEQFIKQYAKNHNYTVVEASERFEEVISEIKNCLLNNQNIHIPKFGNFDIIQRSSRVAHGVKNRVPIDVPEHKVAYFHFSRTFNHKISEKLDKKK